MENTGSKQLIRQRLSPGQSKKDEQEKKNRLKLMLKEEEPMKLARIIDKEGGSQKQIDEYIARITGIEIKVIETARVWHKVLKEIIIEEGKEILEAALTELEYELHIALENKNIKEKQEKAKHKIEETKTLNKEEKLVTIKLEETRKEINEESIITKELAEIQKKKLNNKKTAVEILMGSDQKGNVSDELKNLSQENSEKGLVESIQEQREPELSSREELKDIAMVTENKMDENIEELYLEPYRNKLEDSLWAPNENTCKGLGEYKAKITSISLPGENREERIKFVRGTLHKSNHITKIEENFIKGNLWIVISFDCQKGIDILKEKLERKGVE